MLKNSQTKKGLETTMHILYFILFSYKLYRRVLDQKKLIPE